MIQTNPSLPRGRQDRVPGQKMCISVRCPSGPALVASQEFSSNPPLREVKKEANKDREIKQFAQCLTAPRLWAPGALGVLLPALAVFFFF